MALTGKNLWLIKSDVTTASALKLANVVDTNKPKVVTTTQNVLYLTNPNAGTAARSFTNIPLNLALISKVVVHFTLSAATTATGNGLMFAITNSSITTAPTIPVTAPGTPNNTYCNMIALFKKATAKTTYCVNTNKYTSTAPLTGTTVTTYTINALSLKNTTSHVNMFFGDHIDKVTNIRYAEIFYKINGVDTLVYSVM